MNDRNKFFSFFIMNTVGMLTCAYVLAKGGLSLGEVGLFGVIGLFNLISMAIHLSKALKSPKEDVQL